MEKLLITLLSFLMSVYAGNHQAQASNVTLGSKLYPVDNPWLSPSGNFAFGFYEKGSGFALGIWITGNPNGKIVTWTWNRDIPPLPSDASLEFTKEGRFLILTKQSVMPLAQNFTGVASASLLDSGNFVIYNKSDYAIWESFYYPTDTILQGQSLYSVSYLVSSVSVSDRSSGRFTLNFQNDGNLVAYPINTKHQPLESYWNTRSISNSQIQKLTLSGGGLLYLNFSYPQLYQTIAQFSYPNPTGNATTTIYRATFDDDGIFRLYLHIFGESGSSSMQIGWSSLKSKCQVKGYCGANSYCNSSSSSSNGIADINCLCFPGFVHVDSRKKFLGCYRNFTYQRFCASNESSNFSNITVLEHVTIADYPYSIIQAVSEYCRDSCLSDCNCWAAQHTDGTCNMFTTPILYATLNSSASTTTFIKKISNILQPPKHDPFQTKRALGKRKRKIIQILTPPLAFVAFLFTMLAVFTFLLDRKRAQKYQKLLEMENSGHNKEFTLRSFSYSELEKATDDFRCEIGSNSIWKIYEGIISENNRKVSVAKLEDFEVGEREFEVEMTTMGRIYHKNVVQLVGFCIQGAKKLLVYQFTKNRSLDEILYHMEKRLTWKQRKAIAMDVARGIHYLHEECDVVIVHCNIEPKNILVDDNWTAKISNFASAKLQKKPSTQEENLGKDREKRRYKAPEWQSSASTVLKKVDVHDYGFLLLEIIFCTIITDSKVLNAKEFSSWVYECFVSRKLKELIQEDADMDSLERMVKVGLICIQGDPNLRPSMKDVVLMLEGIMDMELPHSPY